MSILASSSTKVQVRLFIAIYFSSGSEDIRLKDYLEDYEMERPHYDSGQGIESTNQRSRPFVLLFHLDLGHPPNTVHFSRSNLSF